MLCCVLFVPTDCLYMCKRGCVQLHFPRHRCATVHFRCCAVPQANTVTFQTTLNSCCLPLPILILFFCLNFISFQVFTNFIKKLSTKSKKFKQTPNADEAELICKQCWDIDIRGGCNCNKAISLCSLCHLNFDGSGTKNPGASALAQFQTHLKVRKTKRKKGASPKCTGHPPNKSTKRKNRPTATQHDIFEGEKKECHFREFVRAYNDVPMALGSSSSVTPAHEMRTRVATRLRAMIDYDLWHPQCSKLVAQYNANNETAWTLATIEVGLKNQLFFDAVVEVISTFKCDSSVLYIDLTASK